LGRGGNERTLKGKGDPLRENTLKEESCTGRIRENKESRKRFGWEEGREKKKNEPNQWGTLLKKLQHGLFSEGCTDEMGGARAHEGDRSKKGKTKKRGEKKTLHHAS